MSQPRWLTDDMFDKDIAHEQVYVNGKWIYVKYHKNAQKQDADDEHFKMMNGARIAQSLPEEYLQGLLKASKQSESNT